MTNGINYLKRILTNMPYQPFLIADFKTAKSIGKEPWLSPIDAFPTLENMHINKGVLEKRLGFSILGQSGVKHGAVVQTATSITGLKTYLKRGMPSLLAMDSKGSQGAFTGRCNLYNGVDDTWTDISSDLDTPADIFTGSPSDFFHFANWRGVGYMVNNVDQIYQFAGPDNAVVPFNVQITDLDNKANHVDTCQFIFIIDDRLVLLGTTEFGTWFPQRLRFSPVLQTDFRAPGSGTDDAETQERISAAGMIGKTVYAFFEGPAGGSLWKIRRTGNSDIPLEWERVFRSEGSRSPYSGIEFTSNVNDGLVAVGLSDILLYDGFKLSRLNLPMARDILDEFNDSFIRSVFGHYQKERGEEHLLFTFADSSSQAIDRILDFNVTENNWTIHKSNQTFFVNVMGAFNGQSVPSVIELDDALPVGDGALVSEITVDSRAILGEPSPFTLIGCRNSRVYKWNSGEFDGTNDVNGTIAINAKSSRWNPFTQTGRRAACEKIGFYVDNDASASFLVSVFKNTRSAAYTTKAISCDSDDDDKDKFWVWVFCDGEIGDFHRISITHDERGNTPRIHAIMPYFAQAGRIDV